MLAPVPVPPEGARLWSAFHDCGRFRPGFAGPEPLAWGEIESFARMAGVPLEPWEARGLRELSEAFVDQWHDNRAEAPPAERPNERGDPRRL